MSAPPATEEELRAFLADAGLPLPDCAAHAQRLAAHRVALAHLPDLTHDLLVEVGIGLVGDRLRVLAACGRLRGQPHHPPPPALADTHMLVCAAAAFLHARTGGARPEVGIILGSGLGAVADQLECAVAVSFSDVPHFPTPTAQSHAGRLLFGTLHGRACVLMQGRAHVYEGYHPRQAALPVYVMKALGVRTLVVTNACGALVPCLPPRSVVVLSNHINMVATLNPLCGHNDDRLGERWPSLKQPYCPALAALAWQCRADTEAADSPGGAPCGLDEHGHSHMGPCAREPAALTGSAVYVGVSGPCGATHAELQHMRRAGGHVFGYSTVHEVIVAAHASLAVLGLCVVADACTPFVSPNTSTADCLDALRAGAPQLASVLSHVVRNMP